MTESEKRREQLLRAYQQRDDVAFEAALQTIFSHEKFLNKEIVQYRQALNEIAWPKDTINGPLPRKIAIEVLDASAIGQRLKEHFSDALAKSVSEDNKYRITVIYPLILPELYDDITTIVGKPCWTCNRDYHSGDCVLDFPFSTREEAETALARLEKAQLTDVTIALHVADMS
ncbi:MAG: hypothetical protein KGL39_00775 [Patescibacteria group bacterium]|nr:hypothetical protein [Patescibacteria group bacterium]